MPKPEPKPVVTLDEGHYLHINGSVFGAVFYRDQPLVHLGLYQSRSAAELRAIADWLDQWQDATLLSEVAE